jgi:hypothetical protein
MKNLSIFLWTAVIALVNPTENPFNSNPTTILNVYNGFKWTVYIIFLWRITVRALIYVLRYWCSHISAQLGKK